jgi:hypothetical protein
MRFELPTLSAAQPPAVTSARSCKEWLSVQPLANAIHAQAVLLRQLNLLNRYDLAAAERLKILELIRDPVAFAQGESARKFAGRPLPLAQAEQAGLDANRQLWQALAVGYLHCLSACFSGDPEVAGHAALIIQRAIAALRGQLLDIYRAAQEPPGQIWRAVHELYGAAEELGVTEAPVSDPLQVSHPLTSVRAAYAHTLLLHQARPYELSSRQLLQVERWMHRWANRVAVLDAAPAADKARFLVADLESGVPAAAKAAPGGRLRWLELSALANSIKTRIVKLEEGASPASLKLGEDCVQPACENLLKHLYRCWFKGGTTRAHTRHPAHTACRLVVGMEAIHYYVSGTIFRQPMDATLSKRHADEIAVFGRIATRYDQDYSQQHGFMIEQWLVLDESPAGVRIGRKAHQSGVRVAAGQLLALRLGEAPDFLLAVARWVRVSAGDELQTGVRIFPGLPRPVAVRGTGLSAVNEKFRQGFILPAAPALHQPETVIVPAGWFRSGRVIEIHQDRARQVRLKRLMDRGADFERVAFEPV